MTQPERRVAEGYDLFLSLERAVRQYRDQPAVVDADLRWTYGDLHRACVHMASALTARGLGPGDRVAVMAANSAAYLTAYYAVPLAGMVLVPLNTRLQEPEVLAQVTDCSPAVILADPLHRLRAEAVAVACGIDVLDLDGTVVGQGATDPDPAVLSRRAPDELAAIFYTGGTTGRAKGVMLTHENLAVNALHMVIGLGYSPADTYLHCAPMFHLGDGMSLYPLTWVGGRHVIVPRFDPAAVIEAIARESVTCTFLVPTMLTGLVEHLTATPTTEPLSSLRLVVHGGAPIARTLLDRAMVALPCSFTQSYGMTEAGPILSFLPREEALGDSPTLQSAGRPVVGVEVRVTRPDGAECEPGEIGEITARGPNVSCGYWNQPEVTAEKFRDGWYRSGDLAYRDDTDHLFIIGRAGDVVISGGENIYAAEVEAALAGHPEVVECAVFAVPDAHWGETVAAAVVIRSSQATTEDLDRHCRALIAGYKVPRRYEVHTRLPRTGAGKIDKARLREPHWRDHGRGVS